MAYADKRRPSVALSPVTALRTVARSGRPSAIIDAHFIPGTTLTPSINSSYVHAQGGYFARNEAAVASLGEMLIKEPVEQCVGILPTIRLDEGADELKKTLSRLMQLPGLEKHAAYLANGSSDEPRAHIKAVYVSLVDAAPGVLSQTAVRESLEVLAADGLRIEIRLSQRAGSLDELAEAANALAAHLGSDVDRSYRIIIANAPKDSSDRVAFAAWAEAMTELAIRPEIRVSLSGLIVAQGAKAFKAAFDEQVNEIESQAIGDNSARAALRAGVEQLVTPVLEAFGAERLVFSSGEWAELKGLVFPDMHIGHAHLQVAFDLLVETYIAALAAMLADHELDSVFAGNARSLYTF